MSLVIMNILAVIAIIALLGLLYGVLSAVSAVKLIIATGKSGVKKFDKIKASGLRLFSNGKRIVFEQRDHAVVVGGHAKKAVGAVASIKGDVETIIAATKVG